MIEATHSCCGEALVRVIIASGSDIFIRMSISIHTSVRSGFRI